MRHYLTFSFLCAAVACYALGWARGIAFFVLAGLFFESIFWFRLLRKKKHPSPPTI